jgi:hypothetical protein
MPAEDPTGERAGSDSSPPLEGTELECFIAQNDNQAICDGESGGGVTSGEADDTKGRQASTGLFGSSSSSSAFPNIDPLVLIFLRQRMSDTRIRLCLDGFRPATLKNYLYAWRIWAIYLRESKRSVIDFKSVQDTEEGFIDFLEWMLVEKTFSTGSFLLIRSAVSSLCRMAFKGSFGLDFQARLMARKMRHEQPRHSKRKEVFDVVLLLRHYRSMPPNDQMEEKWLRAKVATMLILYIQLRLHDMLRIDMEDMKEVTGGLQFDSVLKNVSEYAECSLARVVGEDAICPVAAVLELWKRVQKRRGKGKGLFFVDNISIPLRRYQLEQEMRQLMKQAGIPKQYTPYSIKHASITYLLAHGVSENVISRNARLSQNAGTAVKYYFLGQACLLVTKAIATAETKQATTASEGEWKEVFHLPYDLPRVPQPFTLSPASLVGIDKTPHTTYDDVVVDPLLFMSVCEFLCSSDRRGGEGELTPQGEGGV